MRADRLLSILLLLQVHRQMTARELAQRLEVSERTIQRDMEALSAAGFPVLSERGSSGGWKLLEGYRTNLTGLNAAEVQSLFLTRPLRLLADLGFDKASEAGLLKLQAALPLPRRRDIEFARERIYVDVTGWNNAREAVPLLPALLDAVWNDRKVRIAYERGHDDCAVERLLDPLGLVAKGSVWYLVAAIDGQVRSYRVSRIRQVETTGELCERPADFDLVAHWQQAAVEFRQHFPRFPVTLRAHPEAVGRLHFVGRFSRVEQTSAPDEDGWVTMTMDFQVADNACEILTGFGAQIEIINPPELRADIIARAREVIAWHEQGGTS